MAYTNDNSESVAKAASLDNSTVTENDIRTWNPYLNSNCDNLLAGDVVCISRPGSYASSWMSNATANGDGRQHGGKDASNGGKYNDLTAKMNNNLSTAHAQRKSSSYLPCTNSNQTQGNVPCASMTQEEEISPNHLYNVNVPGRSPSSISTSSPSATIGASGGQAAPSPTQLGISPSCNKYSQAPQGDTCATLSIAIDNRISKELLYAWNNILGTKGQSCDANYWAKYWYCVGVNPALVGRVSSGPTSNPAYSTMSAPKRFTLPSSSPSSESERSRKKRMIV